MPLMNSLKQPKPILSEAEIKSIFSYWNNILEFHTKVLKPQIHARIVILSLFISFFFLCQSF